uniref:Uncharacterized protein n=1 Tax=Entomoneis paludosa TaxID=265537 RepID=A0A7S2V7L6_9STRA
MNFIMAPIHDAAWAGDLEKVKELLESGVDVETRTEDNQGQTPLHWAIMAGQLEVVQYLVEQKGANVEAQTNYGATPLHWASLYGKLEVVQYLVEHGANVEAKSTDGWTALDMATKNGHNQVKLYLQPHDVLFQLKREKQSWPNLEETKEYNELTQQIAQLSKSRSSAELQQRFELEQERLTKGKSFQNQMPPLNHLQDWISRLYDLIDQCNEQNPPHTQMAIALAKEAEELVSIVQSREENAAAAGPHGAGVDADSAGGS